MQKILVKCCNFWYNERVKTRQKQDGKSLLWQLVVGLNLVAVVVVVSLAVIFYLAQEPYSQTKKELTRIAQKEARVQVVEDFAFFNGQESYASLLGRDVQGKTKAVLWNQDKQQVYVYSLDELASQSEAIALAQKNGADVVERVTFGREGDIPVWEVKSGSRYYIIDAKEKKFLH